jgi:putative peptide zinc metalloprotease protein
VQLSRLLHRVAELVDGMRDPAAIAAEVSRELGRPVSAGNVSYLLDRKLRPLGLVLDPEGATAATGRIDPLLALRFRVGLLPPRAVAALGDALRPLFLPPLVLAVLAGVVAVDVWLVAAHGLDQALRALLYQPGLMLAVLGVTVVSLAFHEAGHAAACRYGGARPGAIGAGIYLVFPVFYTDVSDSYRLGRGGRLRTDLGGVYFNAILALAAAVAYLPTGFEPLLVVVVLQQLLILDQFAPWLRLDGYYVVGDLIGVPDLFARVRPVLLSLLPNRPVHPRVRDLRPWARAAVTAWVLTAVAAIAVVVGVAAWHAPGLLATGWDALLAQVDRASVAWEAREVGDLLGAAVGAALLLVPPVGLALTYLQACRRVGITLAHRQAARGRC